MTTKIANHNELNANDMHKYLSFMLHGKDYAINISKIKEIIEKVEVIPIPMMPDFFLGTINLRGRVLSVIDLAKRLGMDAVKASERSCILVVELTSNNMRMDIGVVVDAVSQVTDILPNSIEAAPSLGGLLKTEFMQGMGKVNENFIILLNIDELLSLEDIQALGNNEHIVPENASGQLPTMQELGS